MDEIVGAVTWVDHEVDHAHATIVDRTGAVHCVAAPAGGEIAIALEDARIHGDQVAVAVVRRGLDIDDPFDMRPRVEATRIRTTWRVPRLGDTTWGPVPAGEVIAISIPRRAEAPALPMAA